MGNRPLISRLSAAVFALLAGCGQPPPPPPPGATVEQLRAVAEAADAVRKENLRLEARVAGLEVKVEEMRRAEENARQNQEAEIRRLAELIEGLTPPAGKEPADPPVKEDPNARVKGMVLASDPKMDIYLVSVGAKDGLKIGDELTVFRGDAFVAVVIVDQVFRDKASVIVKKLNGKPMKRSDIKTGDRVSGGASEPPPPDALPAPIKGHVLAADSEKGVYLVSVGKKDGVKVADELTVFRGDSFVAVVVVDTVFEDRASVVVKKLNGKPMLKSEIKAGDKVASVL